MKTALITGITGQDGSYLAEHLLSLGYHVFGLVRRAPESVRRLRPILGRIDFVYGDLKDTASLEVAVRRSNPDEIYNLAAQAFVPTSWSQPEETFDVNTAGLARILDIAQRLCPKSRVYQASSSEMFGNVDGLCNEETPLSPLSPYGVSKAAAHQLVKIHRKLGLFVVGGILFNHDSPRRTPEMVTKKIVCAVGQWSRGNRVTLELGSLEPRRDWGYAPEYVTSMHLMLQGNEPCDYVIATGESHSVGEFLHEAIRAAGLNLDEHVGLIRCNEALKRKNEIADLRGSAKRAQLELGWSPRVKFRQLVTTMVEAELEVHSTV